jgi:phosphomannomutase|tara:strand:- start:1198 stop:2028 length:831 start_codon:yes stop_codon:yes gene_type:complete
MKELILFDMDGTISDPRGHVCDEFISLLPELSKRFLIGIVTGSHIKYIREQASFLFHGSHQEVSYVPGDSDGSFGDILIFPCNGTQHYVSSETSSGSRVANMVYSKNMISEVGKDNYYELIKIISKLQLDLLESSVIPVSGTFISFRGSMVNWCPIGRSATDSDRLEFSKLDKDLDLRVGLVNKIKAYLDIWNISEIEIALGGVTSLDIYPSGWDKTYCLPYIKTEYPDIENIYFFGDKCLDGQNDCSIYRECYPNSFSVSSKEETVDILKSKFII